MKTVEVQNGGEGFDLGESPSQMPTRKKGMSRLLELAFTKKALTIGAILLSIFSAIANFIPYLAIYKIVQVILSVYPNLTQLPVSQLMKYGWWAFGGVAANVLLYTGALVCSHLAAFGTLYQLKVEFASHLAKLPLGFHVTIGSGRLRKIMDENIEKVENFIAHQLPDISAAYVSPIAMFVIVLAVDWRFGIFVILGVISAVILQMRMYGKEGSKEMMEKFQASMEQMNNASVEYVRGISVVKAFGQTVYSFKRLNDTIKEYTSIVIPYTLSWENGMSAFLALINNLYLFVVPAGIIIGQRTTDYKEFAATFIFYLIFIPSIAGVLLKLMYVNSDSMRIIGGVEAMDAVLDEPELAQPKSPSKPTDFDIQFEDVSFSYEKDHSNPVLQHLNFIAKQGEVTALVGASGGGKSTIANLIPRFFDVTEGSIKLGNVDLRKMKSSELMNQVSFVFQDVFLFKQSVKENIRLGNLEATDEEIIAASKAAQCHDFIMSLPKGYDTVIGTEGVHLSGGEEQRIAIARAIVKNAPVVILDEATAFADPENEHLIQKAFETLLKGKTVVMIAHRLSTIRNAQKILVIEEGQIIEEGRHDELLQKSGRYSQMWQTYQDTISWKMSREEVKGNA